MICSVCSKEIEDFEKDLRGDIYCIECYRKKYLDSECVECGKIGRGYKTDYHGNEYCDECFDISTHTCDNCGDVHSLQELQKMNGVYYCRNCFEEIFVECSNCRELVDREDSCSTANGDIICDKCFDRHYFTCYHCDEVYHIDNGINVINSRNREVVVCRDCSNDYYVECYSCGAIIHIDISYYREYDGYSYCEDCYPGERPELECHCYGYKPSPIFHNLGEKTPRTYYGIEMEVENHGDGYSTNDAIYSVKSHSDGERLFYIKEDGSLENGFEIVTHPCTLGYHKKEFPWKDIKSALDKWDCEADSTCGLHIHVSKRIYSELDLIKLALFIFNSSNRDYIKLIARRGFNNYARRKELSEYKKKDLRYSQSRFEAINFTNEKTVEFRMFSGTTKPEVVVASIEFVDSVTNFIKNNSISTVSKEDSWADYISYVIENGKKYKTLINYMKEKFEHYLSVIL